MSNSNNNLDNLETELEDLVSLNLSNSGSAEISYSDDSFEKDVFMPDLSQYLDPSNPIRRIPFTTTTTTTTTTSTIPFETPPSFTTVKEEPSELTFLEEHTQVLTHSKVEYKSEEEDDEEFFHTKRSVLSRTTRKRKNSIDPIEEEIQVGGEKLTKRRERNRESAAASRQRKREHISTLEEKIHHLKEERIQLGKSISHIEGQNKAMNEEISHLKNLVSSSPLLSSMRNRTEQNVQRTQQQSSREEHSNSNSPIIKAAFFLFLVLFCAFNSSHSLESNPKIVQPLLNNYFNFLATDGRPISQDQLQHILNTWLTDPLGLQIHSTSENSHHESNNISEILSQYLHLGSPSENISDLTNLNPSLYDAIFQIVNSLPRRCPPSSIEAPSFH